MTSAAMTYHTEYNPMIHHHAACPLNDLMQYLCTASIQLAFQGPAPSHRLHPLASSVYLATYDGDVSLAALRVRSRVRVRVKVRVGVRVRVGTSVRVRLGLELGFGFGLELRKRGPCLPLGQSSRGGRPV